MCHEGELTLEDVAPPRPGPGQVVLDVTGCGICGSDLHARRHADALADVLADAGYPHLMRAAHKVVMGHEFCGTVAEYGPSTRRRVPTGTPVVALPLRRAEGGMHAVGLSQAAPGGYAEQVLVEESLMLAVPNGLAPSLAVLTEPMAIGYHAVRRGEVAKGDVAVVLGCGPVGLAVVCMLKAQGVRTVVASDPSPGRRRLAQACGADIVVDPVQGSPFDAYGDKGHLRTVPDVVELALTSMEKLRRLPLPWEPVYRLAERLTGGIKRPVVFECVGIPGMLDSVIGGVPLFSRVVVVGVCMEPDTIRPAMAVNKEVELRFVVGYSPLEFRDTLHLLASGKVDATPLLTGTVGLPGVEAAFAALADPEQHAKIVIDPRSQVAVPA